MSRFFSFFSKHKFMFILGLFSVCWIYPITLIFLNSFKSYNDMMLDFIALPKSINFDMYKETWTTLNFPHLIGNTLFYTIISVGIIGIIAPMAAYKLTRNQSKLSKVMYAIIILPMMVPFQTYMLTLTRFMTILGLNNTRQGYILVNVGLCMPLAVFMISGFVNNIPKSLDESAYIDGAGGLKTYFSVILPLLVPILTTVLVIDALAIWNDVVTNILILGSKPETINLQQALFMRFSANQADWEHALPGITMSIIPNLIFFIFMQKYIVAGVTAGSVKE